MPTPSNYTLQTRIGMLFAFGFPVSGLPLTVARKAHVSKDGHMDRFPTILYGHNKLFATIFKSSHDSYIRMSEYHDPYNTYINTVAKSHAALRKQSLHNSAMRGTRASHDRAFFLQRPLQPAQAHRRHCGVTMTQHNHPLCPPHPTLAGPPNGSVPPMPPPTTKCTSQCLQGLSTHNL
jgi:hypothetical protein